MPSGETYTYIYREQSLGLEHGVSQSSNFPAAVFGVKDLAQGPNMNVMTLMATGFDPTSLWTQERSLNPTGGKKKKKPFTL